MRLFGGKDSNYFEFNIVLLYRVFQFIFAILTSIELFAISLE